MRNLIKQNLLCTRRNRSSIIDLFDEVNRETGIKSKNKNSISINRRKMDLITIRIGQFIRIVILSIEFL